MFKEAKFIYGLSCIEEPPAGEISGIGKLHKCLSDASYLKANKQVVLPIHQSLGLHNELHGVRSENFQQERG